MLREREAKHSESLQGFGGNKGKVVELKEEEDSMTVVSSFPQHEENMTEFAETSVTFHTNKQKLY